MTDAVTLKGEAREVALAEAQTVQAMARDETMRGRLAELVGAVDDGGVEGDAAELLESVLELGLQTGRIRAYYGPGGEQAALATLRRLPRGRVRSDSARDVTSALQALTGARIDAVKIAAVAPGAFTLSIEADGLEATVRLDGTGARVTSVGHVTATTWRASISRGRDCLVVGGGRVATEKVQGLLDCDASVTVVAPQIDDELWRLPVSQAAAAFEPDDVGGSIPRHRGDERPRGQRRGLASRSRRCATSPTIPSSAASSCPRSCGAIRSSSASRPAVPRRRSRSGIRDDIADARRAASTPSSRCACSAAAVGEARAADLRGAVATTSSASSTEALA